MSTKRIRLIAGVFITAALVMLILARYLPTEVSADPVIGPPTIEMHLASINSNMLLIKWMAGGLMTMIGLVGSLIVYIFKSTVANIKSSIGHVETNLKEDIQKNETDIDNIKEKFMSIKTHALACPHNKGG